MSDSEIVVVPIVESTDYYGKYIKRSRACVVCSRQDHMTINLLRARDHITLQDISTDVGIGVDMLSTHFRNHFIISSNMQRILDLKENSSRESSELVNAILEGNIDIYAGSQGVLESKGQRLHSMKRRISELEDERDSRGLTDVETQEYIQLHRLSGDVEDSILKTYQIIDKKLFPMNREDLSNSILSYKLGVLQKILDDVQITFFEFEKIDQYKSLIGALRQSLANRFNLIEDSILKSGGIIQPVSQKVNDDDTRED